MGPHSDNTPNDPPVSAAAHAHLFCPPPPLIRPPPRSCWLTDAVMPSRIAEMVVAEQGRGEETAACAAAAVRALQAHARVRFRVTRELPFEQP